ncbi:MAG: DUF1684 domain-containing protein [Saprospiraceae bacterium]|nr:DUF1684 domain-containing protein [Saprospiraceae bacterium]MCF8250151.1 DUF1684 domain-containing protein [Saprospiraceae bacterium]MCF8279414.1 DUF1684 domain-containing protein [Bacteroidales bacterium]MCF8311205.1 DUF1684 domain-containing protein [Saprospiraceae bacterium]MCF8440415.1 DUF1684 domain-containing protein [Saprospiraceae bacterium]
MKFRLILFLLGFFFVSAFGQQEAADFAAQIAKHREAYKADFLKSERSPLDSADLPNLRFFEANEAYRVVCVFHRTPKEEPFDVPTSSGITKSFVKYGFLTFELEGRMLKLAVYQNLTLRNMPIYAQHLFLPFRDESNGDATYGGGRYIDLTIAAVEAEAPVLDFNKCYNPWCHYSDGYNCPIPPVENTLDVEIPAGEATWAGVKKH